MKSVVAFAALILALVAAGIAGYGFLESNRKVQALSDEIASLRLRIEADGQTIGRLQEMTQEAAQTPASPQVIEKDMAELREKVQSVKTRMEVLDTQVAALRESDKSTRGQVARIKKQVDTAPAGVPPESVVRREDVEKLIEQKMKGHQPQRGPVPIEALAEQLKLDEAEKKAIEDILRQKKNERMTLLKTPRADGSNLLDEFADGLVKAMSSGEPDEHAMREVHMKFQRRMMTEKVPGGETTYAEITMKQQQETREALKAALSREQYQAFEAMGIPNALEQIRIPDDPMEIYIHQRLQAAGVLPERPRPPGR
jgi:hypothetical protein